ncbi:hypothetical protein [uncultured Winogradskyella sp.]|uniref:hypothetical protein n=1 Tax=uncultured Winogradskyella sp. TaxID=395353 RepID=UPI0030EBCD6B|tara:strand:+ start:250 stop:714 length:465 start_codon:yes stop_codon:yes gene_type:complete
MTKAILKDKLLGSFFLATIILAISLRDKNDWWFILVMFLIALVFLCTISILKTDLYVHCYSYESGMFQIEYQKNFYKKQLKTFSINAESITSYKFSSSSDSGSNSNQNTFSSVYLKYTDDDGDTDDKTFKFNNIDEFLKLIFELQKNQKEKTIE